MVIITRSAYRKACESLNSSDVSEKNVIPPWCSSGKVYERRKSRQVAAPKWEIRSTYPLRENIWEYLYEDNVERNFNCSKKRRTKRYKQTSVLNRSCMKASACLFVILIIAIGTIVSFWKESLEGDLTKLISLSLTDARTSVSLECCHRLKYLTEELAKAEQTLRNTLRSRTMMLSSRLKTVSAHIDIDTRYISGASAAKGADTKEWGGRVALWGIIPLWRATPPADLVLALRAPTLSDCWPFIGSYGEIIIQLPKIQRISYVTVEHIRPDTARSAPKHFVIYGVLANNTRIKVISGQYRAQGAAKQYYPLAYKQIEWKSLVFRVLSNQGNTKYTCIYRIHLYGNLENDLAPIDNISNNT